MGKALKLFNSVDLQWAHKLAAEQELLTTSNSLKKDQSFSKAFINNLSLCFVFKFNFFLTYSFK